jgi:hypothetical protein
MAPEPVCFVVPAEVVLLAVLAVLAAPPAPPAPAAPVAVAEMELEVPSVEPMPMSGARFAGADLAINW